MERWLIHFDFREGDLIYLVKNNKIQKDKVFKVYQFDFEEGGTFHDGYEITIYAYIEDENTRAMEKCQIGFFNVMCQIKQIYAYNIRGNFQH